MGTEHHTQLFTLDLDAIVEDAAKNMDGEKCNPSILWEAFENMHKEKMTQILVRRFEVYKFRERIKRGRCQETQGFNRETDETPEPMGS